MKPIGINDARALWLRRQARRLREEYWFRTAIELGRPLESAEKLPVSPKAIATKVLGLCFEEPDEVGTSDKGILRVELAGALNRSAKKILVARKFSPEIQRFTGAHEIAHYLIHPDLFNLRESPLTEGSIRNQKKPTCEKEADLFAAELLIPSDIVFDLFGRLFGDGVDGAQIRDDQAYCVSNGRLAASEISRLQPLERARLIAGQSSLVAAHGRSLADIFGVSATAVGIRLLDLELVR
jgi:hypothetical protein